MTGAELRKLRSRLGYSLTEIAAQMGVDVSTICRYQSGALSVPRWFELAVKRLPKKGKK